MKRKSVSAVGWTALLLCSFACLAQAGEAASSKEASGGWPEQLGQRKLYRSDYGFVYARDKSAARQAQKTLADVVKDVGRDGATRQTAGLVLVVDVKEKFPFDVDGLLQVMSKAQAGEPNGKSDDAAKSIAEGKEEVAKLGLNMETVLSIMPIPIKPVALREITRELPEDVDRQIAWCAIVPTGRCAKAGFKKIIDAGIKKAKPSLAERAALAVMMPLVERKVVSQTKKAQQALFYELLLEARSDLSAEQRKLKVEAYKKELGLDGDFPIGSGGNDKDKATPEPDEEDE
jgi:hypothetical protein